MISLGQTDHFAAIQFMENKGQWDPSVRYKGDIQGGSVLLRNQGFTFSLLDPADVRRMEIYYHGNTDPGHLGLPSTGGGNRPSSQEPPQVTPVHGPRPPGLLHGQIYAVNFLNASTAPQMVADHPSSAYYNYYIGNDSSRWKSGVHSFEGVTYKSMYPDIDVRVYSEASQLKYDLIVYPGGNLSQVQLQYKGMDRLEMKKGMLVISTRVGEITELAPYAYQMIGNQKVLVSSQYKLENGVVSFRVKSYDHTQTLIIDPNIIFASFTGARNDNWGYTATYDSNGDLFLGGIVFGPGYPAFPTNPGPFQATYGGGQPYEGNPAGFDMGICKFDPGGRTLIYATYLGGSSNDQPHSLVVDSSDNLIVAGRTESTDFPVTATDGPGGRWDITVTKFNAAGTKLLGSIKIGGKGDDGVNITDNRELGDTSLIRNYGDDARSEVITDGSGNIFLVGSTQSADFPISGAVFQPVKGALQDGVVMEIKPDCSGVVWSSFMGGDGDDAAYVIDIDHTGNLYVAGGTSSNNLPTSVGVIQPAYGGGLADGFIAEIRGDGSALLRMTYLGTSSADEIYGLQLDAAGSVYINGTTNGIWTVTANGNYPGIQPNGKQFICKLQPDLSAYIYSTVFGDPGATVNSRPNISPVAFLVDRCQNVYISGWGGPIYPLDPAMYPNSGTSGLPVTADALQKNTDGRDFYFFVLKRDATAILFASFYGQRGGATDHVDGGTSRFDKNGVIYEAICANCGDNVAFPTTPGVWSPRNGYPSGCNEVGLKIAFFLNGVSAGLRTVSGRTYGCIPLSLQFEDTVRNAKQYDWNFGDGTPDTMTTSAVVPHTYSLVGTFRVLLIAIDSTSCNISDTTYLNIRAKNNPVTVSFLSQKIPPCTSTAYQFTNTSVAPAGPPFLKSFTWIFGDGTAPQQTDTSTQLHAYPGPGTYPVDLIVSDTTYCNAPDTATQDVVITPLVKAAFTTPAMGCIPYTASFTKTSTGGLSFQWNFGDGTTFTAVSPTHLYPNPGTFTITLIAVDSTTCNGADTTSSNITVSAPPVAGFTFAPVVPLVNTGTTFTNTAMGASRFLWTFGDGTEDSSVNPFHVFPKTGTYQVCQEAFNPVGCMDSVCESLSAIIVPKFDIPNAFSPNGDGINDIFIARGFGIVKFDMKIFNRWGQMLFETNSISRGWDGKFKGIAQPVDVYVYTADLTFSDGTSATRSGSVTLLR